MVKLSEWAKDNNIDYRDAWKQAKAGVLPVKTKISKTNRIWLETDLYHSLYEYKDWFVRYWTPYSALNLLKIL